MEPQSFGRTLKESLPRTKFDKNLLSFIKEKIQYTRVKSILRQSNIWNAQDKVGNALLHIASKYNNEVIAKYLINNGSKVDILNESKKTPLIVAVENSSRITAEALLEAGANIYTPDNSGKNALHWFLRAELFSTDIAQVFLNKIRDDCSNDNQRIADTLYKAEWPLHYVVLLKNVDFTRIILSRNCQIDSRDRKNQTALHKVVQAVDVNHVDLLLQHHADPNVLDDSHRSPLHYLYDHDRRHSDGHLKILKMLLAHNAALTISADYLNWRQVDLTLRYGNREAVELLIDANLGLGSKDAGDVEQNTPIHILAKNEDSDVMKALNNRDFIVNARNTKLQSPLWIVTLYGNPQTIEYLLKKGADVNAVDNNDCSALHHAACYHNYGRDQRFKECLKILLEHDADPQLVTKSRSADDFRTVFDVINTKFAYDLSKIVTAHVVVRETRGIEITEHTQTIIEGELLFKNYYEYCKQQLNEIIDKNVTLLDLLNASDSEFEIYVRNEQWTTKMYEFCNDEKEIFSYLDTMLVRKIERASRRLKLKLDAASVVCKLMGVEYANLYSFADRIIGFLSLMDWENLLEVPL